MPGNDMATEINVISGYIVAISASLTAKLITEDTGLHTNPELYKVNNSFRSQVVARAGGVYCTVDDRYGWDSKENSWQAHVSLLVKRRKKH